MSTIGNIGPFDDSVEDYTNYLSRVELFFVANSVADDKKVATFLTLAGAKIYALAKRLLSPTNPAEATYDALTKALKDHFKPKTIIIFERYKFYSRRQKNGESIADFVAGIKSLAHSCSFGDQLSDMLRDRFVMGLNNEQTQHALLAESDLTFQRALEVATAREAAYHDAQAMGNQFVNKLFTETAHKSKPNSQPKPKTNTNYKQQHSSSKNKPKSPCTGCGGNHWKNDCPFKDKECYKCKMIGHIQKMCRTPKKFSSKTNVNYTNPTNITTNESGCDSYDYLFNVTGQRSPPITLNLLLINNNVEFEVDTGATKTIISRYTYETVWKKSRPKLLKSTVHLKVYGGSSLRVAGEINVNVQLPAANTKCKHNIVVTEDCGPSLLCRDLLQALQITEVKLSSINKVSSSYSHLLTDFPDLFSPGLGCLTGCTISIDVDTTISPKYCKPRNIPYALRDKVDKELQRLTEENIISPVTFSPWAAAIVPVLKPNGSIRICGDYKLTVNRAARLDTYPIPKLEDLFSKLAGSSLFTKLDMSQAYAQLMLDDASKPYTVINTYRSLFAYNRLCFGNLLSTGDIPAHDGAAAERHTWRMLLSG